VVATSAPEGPEQLLRHADSAMYEAKRRGKARAHLFHCA
jgi:PleD family two-component response regulator